MIVECICDIWVDADGKRQTHLPCPKRGDLNEVVTVEKYYLRGHTYILYRLYEYEPDRWFDSVNFREVDVNIDNVSIENAVESVI